jgi:protein SCO1/2
MRVDIVIIVALAVAAPACGKPGDHRTYRLQGQVLSLDAPRKLTIKHEEIKGLMPAMTMPYEVKDEELLTGLAAGDLINATLVIVSNDAYLATIRKVGQAPLEKPPAQTTTAPAASSGFELLKPGEQVPRGAFLDQDGRERSFESFKGSPVVLTFIYTRCPLPTFCPLMDRHFVTIQNTLKEEAALRSVHLVTVSFDPSYDTPPVLKKHARILKADLSRWTFLTGDRDEVDKFAMRFGVSIARAMNDPRDITHNLRTAIIDAEGRLVKVYTGNDWTPEQVLTDLKPVVRAN